MEIGKDEKALLEIAHRQKGPVSEKIKNAPDLLPGLQFYVDAFNLLTTSRPTFQGGIGFIPYSEISQFCKDEGIRGSEREDLFFLVGQIDQFYVDWHTKNIKKKMESELSSAKAQSKATKARRR